MFRKYGQRIQLLYEINQQKVERYKNINLLHFCILMTFESESREPVP